MSHLIHLAFGLDVPAMALDDSMDNCQAHAGPLKLHKAKQFRPRPPAYSKGISLVAV